MIADLVRLARPKGTALVLLGPLTGYGFAHWDFELDLRHPGSLVLVLIAWVLLSAGSLWLNAVLDGDEGGALFATSRHARRPPRLASLAYVALATATALACIAGEVAGIACAVCSVLAIVYSHPRTMWKAHPVLGPVVNAVGYGVLSWLAGWSVVSVPMTSRTAAAMVLVTAFILGMYFAAQSFQREDDARRGYRTLVVLRGPAACLRAAITCTRIAMLGVATLAASGVYPRIILLGIPVYAFAEITMSRWRRAPSGGSPKLAAQFAYRMLAAGTALVALATFDVLR